MSVARSGTSNTPTSRRAGTRKYGATANTTETPAPHGGSSVSILPFIEPRSPDRKSTRLNSSHSQKYYAAFFFLKTPRPPRPPLFPYTTLFRSATANPTETPAPHGGSSVSILPFIEPRSPRIRMSLQVIHGAGQTVETLLPC